MKNQERQAIKAKNPSRDRARLVLGPSGRYDIYLRNFLYTPITARRLDRPGMLYGIQPDRALVILLQGWQQEARFCPGLLSAVMYWRDRWRDMGLEEITDLELDGGREVRQEMLRLKYEQLLDRSGSNSIAIESARDWIRRLDESDAQLLLKAINEQKTAKVGGEKNL